MTTRFLLHGGRLKYKDKRNDSYFKELTKNLADDDQILFIGFARRDEADRAEVYEREKGFILAQTDTKIKVINATYDNLIEQIKSAKTIHITGGETPELVEDMRNYPDLIGALDGKLVGGSSAGACLFSTYYFYDDETGILEGLGTLPIRLRVHSDNPEYGTIDTSITLLEEHPANLELIQLEECAWVEREVNLG